MILQRYLLRETLQSFAAVIAVLLLIYVSNRFVRFLTEASAGELAADLILELLALKLAASLAILVPAAFYIAVLLALGRLYKDSEVVAMWAGGYGIHRIAQSLGWLAFGVAAVTLWLSLWAGPNAADLEGKLLSRARGEAEIAGLVPGRFREFGAGENVIYVEDVAPDRRSMRNVFVQVRSRNERHVLIARRGYLSVQGGEGDRFMILEDGYRYTGTPGELDYVVTRFRRHAVRLDRIGRRQGFRKLDATPTPELLGSDRPAYEAELQWRLSVPLSVILLGLLAVALARTSPREGKYGKLFTAIVVYFVYNNALGVAQKLIEGGDLPPAVGMWPVHAGLAALAAVMLYMQSAGRRRRSRDHDGLARST